MEKEKDKPSKGKAEMVIGLPQAKAKKGLYTFDGSSRRIAGHVLSATLPQPLEL